MYYNRNSMKEEWSRCSDKNNWLSHINFLITMIEWEDFGMYEKIQGNS